VDGCAVQMYSTFLISFDDLFELIRKMNAYFRLVRCDAVWIGGNVSEDIAVSVFTIVENDYFDYREDGSRKLRLF
jgi:hypothetical protein